MNKIKLIWHLFCLIDELIKNVKIWLNNDIVL